MMNYQAILYKLERLKEVCFDEENLSAEKKTKK